MIILSLAFPGCTIKNTNSYRNKYIIDVYYNTEQHSIYGSEKLYYKNTENIEMEALFFHIYANAFLSRKNTPSMEGIDNKYPLGFNSGQIDIKGVWIDNRLTKWHILGNDNTILMVLAEQPIKKGQKVEIKIDFQEKLPYAKTNFGCYNNIATFANWYPVLCVYDDAWHLESSSSIGEVNFTEVSDYEVKINLPKDEEVASSGMYVYEKYDEDRKTVILKADNVRDFIWISSRSFKVIEKEVEGVLIKSYFLDEHKEAGLAAVDFGIKALGFFSKSFGEYLYDSYSIVETGIDIGAMNYPKITALGEDYYSNEDTKVLESTIAHETSHQWWYAAVGNNEYMEPWLDESLASYSEAMYLEEYYGNEPTKSTVDGIRITVKSDRSMGDSIDKFKDTDEYNFVVHSRGVTNFHRLRQEVGNEKFKDILRDYYLNNKDKNAKKEDFLEAIYHVSGSEAMENFKYNLEN